MVTAEGKGGEEIGTSSSSKLQTRGNSPARARTPGVLIMLIQAPPRPLPRRGPPELPIGIVGRGYANEAGLARGAVPGDPACPGEAAAAAVTMAGALAGLAAGLQGQRVVPCPDSDSDTDSEGPSIRRSASVLLRSQVIHSGHFMVSSPHSDSLTRRRDQEGPVGLADFGPRSIDPTLTRLFECMSLAYR